MDMLAAEAALAEARTPYATAVVTWAHAPESARPGDRALVNAEGELTGWVGGPVVHPLVVEEALRAIADGAPRVLHVAPPGGAATREGVVSVSVPETSEDEFEVFVQPHLPPPHVVSLGAAPMPAAVVEMARCIGYAGDHVTDLGGLDAVALQPSTYAVVATFGEFDEDALRALLGAGVEYVALVASARRSAALLSALHADGVPRSDLSRVRVPEGPTPGALTHLEVSAAVLADIVATQAVRRGGQDAADRPSGQDSSAPATGPNGRSPAIAVDPVCGARLDPERAAGRLTYDGRTHVFCSTACHRAFEEEPWRYSAQAV